MNFVRKEQWKKIGEAKFVNVESLYGLLTSQAKQNYDEIVSFNEWKGIHDALQKMGLLKMKNQSSLQSLLIHIQKWCIESHWNDNFFFLKQQTNESLELSSRHIRHLLANAFFLNTTEDESMKLGNLDFTHIYTSSRGKERVCCLLSYFLQQTEISEEKKDEMIRFHRRSLTSEIGNTMNLPFTENRITFLPHRMEDSKAHVFVDFANRQIHIGRVIPSHTQEEILFSCAPEAFVALLFVETLLNNEILLIQNVRRFCEYSGYQESFCFEGPWYNSDRFDILVMDAVEGNHFDPTAIMRDIKKAYLGFSTVGTMKRIVSGAWGSGLFKGDSLLKFLQQLCAAEMANVSLDYAFFKEKDLQLKCTYVYNLLTSKGVGVNDLVQFLLQFSNPPQSFEKCLLSWLFSLSEKTKQG
jgi:poly(ADP-ribose) glycohydrolase